MFEENGCVFRFLPFELDEGLRAEGGVGCHCNAFGFRQLEESGLHEVRVVLDLQGCGANFSVSQQIQNQRALEIRHPDTFRKSLVDKTLHRSPSFLYASIGKLDVSIFLSVCPAGWIACLHGHVF